MNNSLTQGLAFGLTSGVITTLGLIVGLNSGTHSQAVVIGAILTIAIADAMSDALGMHVSTESDPKSSNKDIWTATLATFASKFIVALSFIIPAIVFPLSTAVALSIFWGILLITIFSFYISKKEKIPPIYVIGEHLLISFFVIIATHLTGMGINMYIVGNTL